ncbi:hypothetical protein UFOVP211_43 [uncultured Caudovirales phage]|uniref:Uncharacterized protein n=1 Tax=uncultured Caudovirales phage TaxID=2100421 RepID=A0A6J7WKP7_9CAUD|nr:hypothetical protein UFOVP211_43 [uncultured Caudovirales phage]
MKTAIDWLVEQLENHNGITKAGFEKCIQQAKAMEKEQRINDINFGHSIPSSVNINYNAYFEYETIEH